MISLAGKLPQNGLNITHFQVHTHMNGCDIDVKIQWPLTTSDYVVVEFCKEYCRQSEHCSTCPIPAMVFGSWGLITGPLSEKKTHGFFMVLLKDGGPKCSAICKGQQWKDSLKVLLSPTRMNMMTFIESIAGFWNMFFLLTPSFFRGVETSTTKQIYSFVY
jgi:hypothetical protein